MALVAAWVAFGWTLDGYFVGDDFAYVGRYWDFPLAQWPHLFVHGWADGMWPTNLRELRPLNAAAFMLDGRLWGLNPAGFRATNILLHAACATLVGLIARRAALGSLAAGIAAALIFALHPVHAPTITWITGRVDALVTLWSLAALLALMEFRARDHPQWLAALGLAAAAALFTKESALTLPPLLIAADLIWLHNRGALRAWKTWAPHVVMATVVIAYFACRAAAFDVAGPSGIGSGFALFRPGSDHLVWLTREVAYLSLLAPPWHAALIGWRDAHFAWAGAAFAGVLALAGVFAAIAGFGWRRWRTRPRTETSRAVIFFCPVWFVLGTVPLGMTYFSARHLYPVAAGLSVAFALVLQELAGSSRKFAAAVAAVALLLGAQLGAALTNWRDSALLSGRIAVEVRRAQRDLPVDGVLLLDVPALVGGAWCWSWAVPHALRPPFADAPPDPRRVVLAPPNADAFPERWRTQPAITALANFTGECLLIRASIHRGVRRMPVAPERVRAAAAQLAPDAAVTDDDAWLRFAAELDAR